MRVHIPEIVQILTLVVELCDGIYVLLLGTTAPFNCRRHTRHHVHKVYVHYLWQSLHEKFTCHIRSVVAPLWDYIAGHDRVTMRAVTIWQMGILHARCSQYIAVLQYRCGYY